jgi:hypothetical protein
MAHALRIGVDFDNTIITYDEVFRASAQSCGLLDAKFAGNKQAVRDAVRLLPDGERAWQRLQCEVYGKGIARAVMVDGFGAFLRRCWSENCSIVIVSHKTLYAAMDPDRTDLRQAALKWMDAQNLLEGERAIGRTNVYFENTRAEKIRRIATLGLTHFIDDLEEVLGDPSFPSDVKGILFGNERRHGQGCFVACSTWREVEQQVFDHV